jgi:hypothetical protein
MRLAFALFAVGASAQTYTSVTFTEYNDRDCRQVNTTVTRPVATCIKEERPNHWRELRCSPNGDSVFDVEFDDEKCSHRVFEFDLRANTCHEGRGHSIRVVCNRASDKDEELLSGWKQIEEQNYRLQKQFETQPQPEIVAYNATSGCVARATVVARAVSKANGQYCECVCPHLAPWRCDCSGLASYSWELAAPGLVTQTLPGVSTRLAGWASMEPGDIILKPSQHVEVFRSWETAHTVFAYCGCHNTADGCSCRTGSTLSYWQANGYYPAKGHNVC